MMYVSANQKAVFLNLHRYSEGEIAEYHNPELQRAVIRVEEMMRDMVESGVEPDLHSFMALLTAYAKVGDVAAAGDALSGRVALTPGCQIGYTAVRLVTYWLSSIGVFTAR
jgi:hypothetical protein